MKKVLALSPHTDDIELGCGGFLSRLKEEGASISVINFAYSKVEGDDTSSAVRHEYKNSMQILIAFSAWGGTPHFPVADQICTKYGC